MRIRKSSFDSSLASNSPASSSSSPPSSISSASSIATNSLASSTDSSSVFSPFSSNSATKCHGLDLLVKAIHMVTAGFIVGVPYIQKRVVRRRRRTSEFDRFIISQVSSFDDEQLQEDNVKTRSMMKRQKRAMVLPSKYQDSLLHQSINPTRRQIRSIQIGDKMG